MSDRGANGGNGRPVQVGHILHSYLGRSESFVYTQLRFQAAFRPLVFARFWENVEEFPLRGLHELRFRNGLLWRLVRRLSVLANGYSRDSYEYELAQAVRGAGCGVLHAHFGPMGSRSVQVARRLGLPLVTTFYGRDVTDSFGFSYAELFRHGERFLCEGPVMVRRLEAAGCPSDKIRLVRIGIDLAAFEFQPRVRTTPLVILQAARFVPKKGIDLSIRAFAAARPSLPDAELWLVGDGQLRMPLERLAYELGVSSSVRFLGMVSHEEYRALLRRAHIGIQPSRTCANDTEGGAPTVLLEMQAVGVPVVSTRHADIPFVVADPDRLADEDDVDALSAALVEMAQVSDNEYRDRAERGRAFVEQTHDARVVAGERESVYREVLTR